jgi:hypothetical protein
MPGPEIGSVSPVEEPMEHIPTLEQWAETYSEMEGVPKEQILELAKSLLEERADEIKETFGSDPIMPIYVKEGITTEDAWEIVKKGSPATTDGPKIAPENIIDENMSATIAFIRFSQDADYDTIGEGAKTSEEWLETDDKLISPRLSMIAREAYRRLTGKQMDDFHQTVFPGYRFKNPRFNNNDVPLIFFNSDEGQQVIFSYSLSNDTGFDEKGVRRMVSREIK